MPASLNNTFTGKALVAAGLAVAAVALTSTCALAQVNVEAGSPQVTADLGSDTGAATGLAAPSTWATSDTFDADIPANQMLIGVGSGFPALTNVAGAVPLSGGATLTSGPNPPANTSANLTLSTNAAAMPGTPAGSSAAATLSAKALAGGGGGGVLWSAPTKSISGPPGGNANFVVSASSGELTLQNNGANAVQGRTMMLWGATGYIPFGGLAEIGLAGSQNITGGQPTTVGAGDIIVGLHAGANPNLAVGALDFVEAGNTTPIIQVNAPVGNNLSFNSFYSPVTANAVEGEYLAEQNDPGGGGIDFQFWALSASGIFGLNSGDELDLSLSTTIITDPGAEVDFDLQELPSDDQSDDDGFDPGAVDVPEPASLLLVGAIASFGLLRRRSR